MQPPRLPRFKRASEIAPIEITERDRDIIRSVYRNRFLRSSHITEIINGSPQQILRRLQLLFHHGYLTRPRAQLENFHGGNREIIYGIGNKGASILKQELGSAFREVSWNDKNRRVGGGFFEHAVLVSDIMVALELACRKNGTVRLVSLEEFWGSHGAKANFKWNVKINNRLKLGVIPDRVFALERDGESPTFIFLEADRGTMPVIRKNLTQSSFYRKLLAYQATWSEGLHRTQFGFNRFRVLTVTTSCARMHSLVDACTKLKKGHRLFLFTDYASIQRHNDILTLSWNTGLAGETSTLLD